MPRTYPSGVSRERETLSSRPAIRPLQSAIVMSDSFVGWLIGLITALLSLAVTLVSGMEPPVPATTSMSTNPVVTTSLVSESTTVPVTTTASPAPATSGLEARSLALINEARHAEGLGPLTMDTAHVARARDWSEHLAERGALLHSPGLGENVGVGPVGVMEAIHSAFVASPSHHTLMMGPWTKVAIGVVVDEGRMWVTQQYS